MEQDRENELRQTGRGAGVEISRPEEGRNGRSRGDDVPRILDQSRFCWPAGRRPERARRPRSPSSIRGGAGAFLVNWLRLRRVRRLVVLATLLLGFCGYAMPAAFAFTTVVIDPGHGGQDRGGIPGQRVPEKVMALDTARRLEIRLRAAGFRTIMTRRDDYFVSLPARVAIANSQRDAIFISIHYNAAPRPEGEGFETYYYTRYSARLAEACYSRIVQAWPGSRRGIRTRGFFVIRKTIIPSVLVEPGFLTNPREAALISRPEVRQRIADLLAAAIISKRRM